MMERHERPVTAEMDATEMKSERQHLQAAAFDKVERDLCVILFPVTDKPWMCFAKMVPATVDTS